MSTTYTDKIPRETALELLTNPKQRMSGRMRRTFRRALEREHQSDQTPAVPFVADNGEYKHGRDNHRSAEAKLLGRFASLSLDKLQRVVIRADRRILKVLRVIAKCETPVILSGLQELRRRLEFIRDLAIAERQRRADNVNKVQADRGHNHGK